MACMSFFPARSRSPGRGGSSPICARGRSSARCLCWTKLRTTVRASRRTSLLRLPRRDFDELIMSHPQILALVSELTDDRRRQTDAILSGTADVGEEGLLLV